MSEAEDLLDTALYTIPGERAYSQARMILTWASVSFQDRPIVFFMIGALRE